MAGCLARSFRPISISYTGAILGAALALNGADSVMEWRGVYGNLLWLRLALGGALGGSIVAFVFSRIGRPLEKRSFRDDFPRS